MKQPGLHPVIFCIHMDAFSKVGFDASHTHVKQVFQQSLIPFNCPGKCKINGTCIIQCTEIRSFLLFLFFSPPYVFVPNSFFVLFGIGSNIRQLP